MGPLLFRNARLVFPPGRGCESGDLLISEGRIIEAGQGIPALEPGIPVVDCAGDCLLPGLVDLHVHGSVGRDAMEASREAFSVILRHLALSGTTTALLSTVSASREAIARVADAAAEFVSGAGEARFEGIHLEGPYFARSMRGAHCEREIRAPSDGETEFLLRHRGVLRRVTLAPEISGALALAAELSAHGISVSAGHSDATDGEALSGFASGITQATHLFNAMSSLRKVDGLRRTGLAEAALTTPDILCELIADGIHLPPPLLRLAWLAKGWKGIALVSDATSGAGLPDGMEFDLGGMRCTVEGGAAWTSGESGRCLAGSTTSLLDGIRTMTEKAGVPLSEAVAMASLVPARSLGLDTGRGSLAKGKSADLVRISPDWEIKGVWIGGVPVKEKAEG